MGVKTSLSLYEGIVGQAIAAIGDLEKIVFPVLLEKGESIWHTN